MVLEVERAGAGGADRPGTHRAARASRRAVRVVVLAAIAAVGLVGLAVPAVTGAADAGAGAGSVSGAVSGAASDAAAEVLHAEAAATGSVDVIVQLAAAPTRTGSVASVASALVDAVDPVAGSVEVLDQLGVVTMTVAGSGIDELVSSGLVARLEPDRSFAPALKESAPQIGADVAWASGFTGAGRTVAIIDSGVETTHPALAGRVVLEQCFTNSACADGSSAMTGPGAGLPCLFGDGCEHGTHVAGIIAARGDLRGVAPDADLIDLQVFSQATGASCGTRATCPRARTSDVLAALDEVVRLAPEFREKGRPIVSVNLSLSSDVTSPGCDDSILRGAVDRLWAVDVATVVAAGNSGDRSRLGIPACISSTVSVGAVDKADTYWAVSNAGPGLDLFAPGVDITSTAPGGGYRAASGTSSAAPHVAAAWAVASQALNTTSPGLILDWFKDHGPAVTAEGIVPARRLDLAELTPVPFGSPLSTTTALVADFDGNGFDDLYRFDPSGASELGWYGPLGLEATVPSAMAGDWRPAAGDFNHDGFGDIFWYSPSGDSWFWWGRPVRGGFEGSGPVRPYGNFTPVVGDFDGDHADDVFLYDGAGGPSYILWMGPLVGWDGFGTVRAIWNAATPGAGFTPVARDVNGDGVDDVVWNATAGPSFLDEYGLGGVLVRRTEAPVS